VSNALLIELFNQLQQTRGAAPAGDKHPLGPDALETFQTQVSRHYTEGTLLRLLEHGDNLARRAALFALMQTGTMAACKSIAVHLHSEDDLISELATDTLWAVWFRASTPENNAELKRLANLRDRDKALAGLDAIIARAPDFAEAYNQRAIVHYRMGRHDRSLVDCERTLRLNNLHFGAQAGMGHCFLQMRKHRAALKAFRAALRIHPRLEGIAETVRSLENALGEEGRRDDKK
jgi:tetratricopeptide (TPR) repeat protein